MDPTAKGRRQGAEDRVAVAQGCPEPGSLPLLRHRRLADQPVPEFAPVAFGLLVLPLILQEVSRDVPHHDMVSPWLLLTHGSGTMRPCLLTSAAPECPSRQSPP